MSLQSKLRWDKIGQELLVEFNKIHSKNTGESSRERLRKSADWMKQKIQEVHALDHANIQIYMKRREKDDERLKKIEKAVQKDITSFLKEEVISASSFSAGTNLVGDSDLDFNVPISPMDTLNLVRLSNLCGQQGYEFAEIRNVESPNLHYVFQRVVEGVEIEIKLNNRGPYMAVMDKVHTYLDHDMTKEDRECITWMKYKFKNLSKRSIEGKEYYNKFKAMYYEYALYYAEVNQMLYPLH
jgi:hypothetical protein